MMGLGSRIQRYIFGQCLRSALLVMSVFVFAIALVDLVEQTRTVGIRASLELTDAIFLTGLKLPLLVEQALPIIILTANLLAFSRLNKRAEIPVVRASGVSAWQFLAPTLILSLIFGGLTITALNPLSARGAAHFDTTRTQLLNLKAPSGITQDGLWLRDIGKHRQSIIHAQSVLDGGTQLENVKILLEERVFEDGRATDRFQFARRLDARRAFLREGYLQLEQVAETQIDGVPFRHDALTIQSNLDPNRLLDRFAPPHTIGFWDLSKHIELTRRAGLDPSRYIMRWHSLIATPLLFVAMALIGALACLRLARLGSMAELISISVGAAIALFFINQLAVSLGAANAIPAPVAAWSPPLFAALVGLSITAYQEDG